MITIPQRAVHLKVGGTEFGFGPPPTLWSPAALGADLLAHFDKRDGVVVGGNPAALKVTSWTSQVGGYVLTPQPGGSEPGYALINGEPVITFGFGAGGLNGSVLSSASSPLNDAGMTIYAVVRRGLQVDGTNASKLRPVVQAPVCLKNGVRQHGMIGVHRPADDAAQTAVFAGQHLGEIANDSTATPLAVGQKGIIAGDFPVAGITARLNGGAAGVAASYYDAKMTRLSIGGNYNENDRAFVGEIDCVLMVKAGLSDATRFKIEGWLAWSFGVQAKLPALHTYAADGPYG